MQLKRRRTYSYYTHFSCLDKDQAHVSTKEADFFSKKYPSKRVITTRVPNTFTYDDKIRIPNAGPRYNAIYEILILMSTIWVRVTMQELLRPGVIGEKKAVVNSRALDISKCRAEPVVGRL